MKIPIDKTEIARNIENLTIKLEEAIDSPSMKFSDVKTLDSNGLYIIFDSERILYVGKTERKGSIRFREMTSDFRSHTLNRKLLSEHILNRGHGDFILNIKSKKKLIEDGILTSEIFKEYQKLVNLKIKSDLMIKFLKLNNETCENLAEMEHFAISALKPKYND